MVTLAKSKKPDIIYIAVCKKSIKRFVNTVIQQRSSGLSTLSDAAQDLFASVCKDMTASVTNYGELTQRNRCTM